MDSDAEALSNAVTEISGNASFFFFLNKFQIRKEEEAENLLLSSVRVDNG